MVRLINILFLVCIFISKISTSNELSKDEEIYFNFLDLNNDNQISQTEINQSINIIFQLVDINQDGLISKFEINELKNIVNLIK
tara:strand:+ start:290 stop:541 length:252 start_codon:yes stop_codon:yes gene_type:complete